MIYVMAMESSTQAELIAPLHCEIGEGPLWHPDLGALFFLDIPPGVIHAYYPSTHVCRPFCKTRVTGGFTLQADGSLLLFQDGHIVILQMNGLLHEVADNQCPGNERFNDVIADPEGRVFAGTLGGNGKLLRFDLDGSVTQLLEGLGIPNGMGFTPDLRGMYFIDSTPRQVYYFDYDRKTGGLSNMRVFAQVPHGEGVPDGMMVDEAGYVWTAVWFGGRLKRYSPDGKLDREVFLPVRQTSAVAFGGEDLQDIYVTTAATTIADGLLPGGYNSSTPRGGGLYRLRIEGIRGKLPFRSRLFL
jgi:D-xylono/L-arabinono-1,4-lactonase